MNRLLVAAMSVALVNVSAVRAGPPLFLGKSADVWRKELSNPDASVRRSAAFAMGRMGEEARVAVSQLVRLLQEDTDAGVRDMAASSVGDIARSVKYSNTTLWERSGGILVRILKDDPSERVRRSAAYALGAFGPQAAGATEYLTKALGDAKASVRQNVAWALGQIGEAASEAVPKLCECLRDKDTLVRRDAAGALGSLGKANAKAARPLIEMLKSESDPVVKKTALATLVPIAGPEQGDSAKDLLPLLDDKDPKIRVDAAIVLAQIGGEEAINGVSVLRSALKDSESEVQEQAAAALATLGPLAKPAMHDLAEALTDAKNTVRVRRNAALAIAHIGPEAKPVVPALVQGLKRSQPPIVRQSAAEALQQMKYPANEKGVPAILDAIENDKDDEVRVRCVFALFWMNGPEFKELGAERVLTKVLDERADTIGIRHNAARKLAQMLRDEAPDKTADLLLEMLSNRTTVIYKGTGARVKATATESSVGAANVRENVGGDARYLAAKALSWMGSKAAKRADVVAALRKAAKDEDATLKQTAKEALMDLGIKE